MWYKKIIILWVSTAFLYACSTVETHPHKTTIVQPSNTPEVATLTDNKSFIADVTETPVIETPVNEKEIINKGKSDSTTTSAAVISTAEVQKPEKTDDSLITPPQPKSDLIQINGQLALPITLPYKQSWVQIGKALAQSGYPAMEQDEASHTYYILDKIGTGGVIKRDTPIYQLRLSQVAGAKGFVTLVNAQNKPVSDHISYRILGALQRQLSHL